MLAVQVLYSVYVGGDAWEYWGGSNRYICIAMPGLFVLLSYALFWSAQVLLSALPRPLAPSRLNALVFPGLIAFSIVSANSIYGVGAWADATASRNCCSPASAQSVQTSPRNTLAFARPASRS